MITVKWKGTFEKVGTEKERVLTLGLSGESIEVINGIIRDYVSCKEEAGWALLENEITEIHTQEV